MMSTRSPRRCAGATLQCQYNQAISPLVSTAEPGYSRLSGDETLAAFDAGSIAAIRCDSADVVREVIALPSIGRTGTSAGWGMASARLAGSSTFVEGGVMPVWNAGCR